MGIDLSIPLYGITRKVVGNGLGETIHNSFYSLIWDSFSTISKLSGLISSYFLFPYMGFKGVRGSARLTKRPPLSIPLYGIDHIVHVIHPKPKLQLSIPLYGIQSIKQIGLLHEIIVCLSIPLCGI